ncbi:helix-turn-helix transcriptional regulator [Faecalibaculum rodentium]|uniref:helix-turn-helix transcriptional regulator n=1 Tax=Faecalibaculum rodentium TaxID=1702221 RepID=UPI00255AB5D7|nr:helix-turn-helix transcriptional regulator [Faecalibaculum rodentium]
MNGLRVKEIRNALDMSQAEFASYLGYSRVYISNLETGVKPVSDVVASKIDSLISIESNSDLDPLIRDAIKEMTDFEVSVTKREVDMFKGCMHLILDNDTEQQLYARQVTTLTKLLKKLPEMQHDLRITEAKICRNEGRYEKLHDSTPASPDLEGEPVQSSGNRVREILEEDEHLKRSAFLLTMYIHNLRLILAEIFLKADYEETTIFKKWIGGQQSMDGEVRKILKRYISRGQDKNGIALLHDPCSYLWSDK